jgi:hypothetical protein
MIQRCHNPANKQYRWYGARGIEVCWSWRHSFYLFARWALAHGYRQGLSIERLDNDAGYCPSNCAWKDRKRQARNTRANRMITAFGLTMCLADWAEHWRCEVGYWTLWNRIALLDWDPERAITTPPQIQRRSA